MERQIELLKKQEDELREQVEHKIIIYLARAGQKVKDLFNIPELEVSDVRETMRSVNDEYEDTYRVVIKHAGEGIGTFMEIEEDAKVYINWYTTSIDCYLETPDERNTNHLKYLQMLGTVSTKLLNSEFVNELKQVYTDIVNKYHFEIKPLKDDLYAIRGLRREKEEQFRNKKYEATKEIVLQKLREGLIWVGNDNVYRRLHINLKTKWSYFYLEKENNKTCVLKDFYNDERRMDKDDLLSQIVVYEQNPRVKHREYDFEKREYQHYIVEAHRWLSKEEVERKVKENIPLIDNWESEEVSEDEYNNFIEGE